MRIKAITNLFQQICFDSSKASIRFWTRKLDLLLRRQCLAKVLSPSDELVCLRCTVRILNNYFPGIRINYHKLFERARNFHLLVLIDLQKVFNTIDHRILVVKMKYLQQLTKSFRLTLVALSNSVQREKFNFCFSQVFCQY